LGCSCGYIAAIYQSAMLNAEYWTPHDRASAVGTVPCSGAVSGNEGNEVGNDYPQDSLDL
jgi:hypothetical protein